MKWNTEEPSKVKSQFANKRGSRPVVGTVVKVGRSPKIYDDLYGYGKTERRYIEVEMGVDRRTIKLMVAEAHYKTNFEHPLICTAIIQGNECKVGDTIHFQATTKQLTSGWVWTDCIMTSERVNDAETEIPVWENVDYEDKYEDDDFVEPELQAIRDDHYEEEDLEAKAVYEEAEQDAREKWDEIHAYYRENPWVAFEGPRNLDLEYCEEFFKGSPGEEIDYIKEALQDSAYFSVHPEEAGPMSEDHYYEMNIRYREWVHGGKQVPYRTPEVMHLIY